MPLTSQWRGISNASVLWDAVHECLLTSEVHHVDYVHHVHCVHHVPVHVKSYGILSPAIRPDLVVVGLRHCLQRRSL